MHMADALVSPTVATVAGIASASLIIIAARRAARNPREGSVALMGVLGAFVFAAQMINFSIPGTGSSGHIIGGILLSALLGPWCGFLTLASVIIVQCLLFADGGLMALGCNILNMAATSCLIAYPLVFKPLTRNNLSPARLMLASVLASLVGLELGACGVSVETVFSGVTALPFAQFLGLMLIIHLAIGAVEGICTGAVLVFVRQNSPQLLTLAPATVRSRRRRNITLLVIGALAVLFAVAFAWVASSNPDGLEWSIAKVAPHWEIPENAIANGAVMPDYSSKLSGLIGGGVVMAILWAISSLLVKIKKRTDKA